jgi:hypothetical protein
MSYAGEYPGEMIPPFLKELRKEQAKKLRKRRKGVKLPKLERKRCTVPVRVGKQLRPCKKTAAAGSYMCTYHIKAQLSHCNKFFGINHGLCEIPRAERSAIRKERISVKPPKNIHA